MTTTRGKAEWRREDDGSGKGHILGVEYNRGRAGGYRNRANSYRLHIIGTFVVAEEGTFIKARSEATKATAAGGEGAASFSGFTESPGHDLRRGRNIEGGSRAGAETEMVNGQNASGV